MRPKELLSSRKQRRIQDVLDPGTINLRIFYIGVISVREKRAGREEQKQNP